MPTEQEIKTVCMICHKHLKGPADSSYVSHGLCEKCWEKIEQEDSPPPKKAI